VGRGLNCKCTSFSVQFLYEKRGHVKVILSSICARIWQGVIKHKANRHGKVEGRRLKTGRNVRISIMDDL